MSAKCDRGIAGNGKGSCNLHRIAEYILDLKSNRMNTRGKCYVGSCSKMLTGSAYVYKSVAVNIDLACRVIQLIVVCNDCREGNAVAVDCSTLVKCNRLILGSVAYIGDGGQHSVIHSRAVIESDIINVEGMDRRGHRLNVGTNERRRTAITFVGSHRHAKVIIRCKINRSVYPARFGDVRLCTGVQILSYAANGSKHEVILLTAIRSICILCIELRLECKTCRPLGNIKPHSECRSILTVSNITKNDTFTYVKQYIVRPTGKIRIGVIYVPSKSILTVSYNICRNKRIAVNVS